MRNTGCSWPIATIYVMQGEIYSDRPYGQHGSAEFSVEMLLRNARNISSSTAPSGRCRGFTRCRPRSAKGSGFSLASAGRTARRRSTSLEKSSTRSTRLAGSKPRRLKEFRPSPCPPGRGRRHRIQNTGAGQIYTGRSYLARAERGLLGILGVEGSPNPDVYNGQVMPGMGH
jgi:nitrite reductase (NO-forming)